MPIYRLEPVKEGEQHHYWNASIVPAVTVWVQATNPDHARRRMEQAARDPLAPPDSKKYSPWTDTALVRCIEDNSHAVPANMALFANGQITLKLQDALRFSAEASKPATAES